MATTWNRFKAKTPAAVPQPPWRATAGVPAGALAVGPPRAMTFGNVGRAQVPAGGIRHYFWWILGVGSFCLLLLGVPLSPTVDMFKTTFKGFTVDVSGYFDGNSAVTVNDGVSALTVNFAAFSLTTTTNNNFSRIQWGEW